MKGFELEISPEIAPSLRRQAQSRQQTSPGQDAWNQLIPLGRVLSQSGQECKSNTRSFSSLLEGDEEEEVEEEEEESHETDILPHCQPLPSRLSEIITRPIVLIDIQKLQGFPANSAEEVSQIKQSLAQALESASFIRTIRDLLEVGVATHAEHDDGAAIVDTGLQLVLEHPAQIIIDDGYIDGHARLDTRQLWNVVASTHDIPVVHRLFNHLRTCHRDLVWKYQLRMLLQDWVQHRQLVEWKTWRQKDQLDQLYQVRQAFEL